MKNWAILALIWILAFASRLFSVLKFESVIHEFDPWFNYRTTIQLVENGYYAFLNWFDELSWYPLGRVVGGTVFPGIMVTAGLMHYIVNLLNFPVHIREICVFLAPVFSGATAVATYLLTKELKDPAAGLLAAAFVAIAPGYISRSVAGSYDNEGISIFLLVITFYFWIKALKLGSAFYGALTALFYFYMVSAWGGYSFIINLIPLHVFVLLLMGRFSGRMYISYSTFYTIGTLASMLVPFIGFQPVTTSEHMPALGIFGLLQIVAFTQMLQSHSKTDLRGYMLFFVVSVALASFALLVILTMSGYIAPWTGRLYSLWDTGYAKKFIPIIASVSEHQPTAWPAFFYDLQLLIVLFPAGVYFCFQELADEHVFVILYAAVGSYCAGVMVRLMLTLTPIVCVASAIAVSKLLDTYLAEPSESNDDSKTAVEVNKRGIYSSTPRLLVCTVISYLLCIFSWHCTHDDFREAYYWLRQNTHEKAKILSWWDYGYQITGMSNRTVLVDNNTWNNTHIATVGKAMSCSEEVSYEIFRKHDVDYVLVIYGGLLGYSGDDINKFLWMIRIGEGVYPKDISERDFFSNGEYALDHRASKTMKESVMYKLSYYRTNDLARYTRENGKHRDNVRGVDIPNTPIVLTHMEEAFSSEHLLVRIYKVKEPDNFGRPLAVASSFGAKRRRPVKK